MRPQYFQAHSLCIRSRVIGIDDERGATNTVGHSVGDAVSLFSPKVPCVN